MRFVLILGLSSAALFGQHIQTMGYQSAVGGDARLLPIATIHSTRGLIVNGVRTPPGVTSAVVAPGDTIITSDGTTTAKFADGRILPLLSSTSYLFPLAPARSAGSSPALIAPVAVTSSTGARDLSPRLGVLSIHRP